MREVIAVPERVKVVMRMLESAANNNRYCPTNSEICTAIGGSSASIGSAVVNLLETMGMISVQRSRTQRIVTINATGKKTAGHIAREAKFKHRRPFKWTERRDAILMEMISEGADFEQAATVLGVDPDRAAFRFDRLAAQFGAQAV